MTHKTEKDIIKEAEKVAKKIFNDENAYARRTNSGNIAIGYTNDYEMQHGAGEQFIIPEALIKLAAKKFSPLSNQTAIDFAEWIAKEKISRIDNDTLPINGTWFIIKDGEWEYVSSAELFEIFSQGKEGKETPA